jgi:hypothetical protein
MDLFRSGLEDLPGSAMPRTKHSLGFLAVQVQLLLTPGPVYGLYLEGEPPQKMLRKLASFNEVCVVGAIIVVNFVSWMAGC